MSHIAARCVHPLNYTTPRLFLFEYQNFPSVTERIEAKIVTISTEWNEYRRVTYIRDQKIVSVRSYFGFKPEGNLLQSSVIKYHHHVVKAFV